MSNDLEKALLDGDSKPPRRNGGNKAALVGGAGIGGVSIASLIVWYIINGLNAQAATNATTDEVLAKHDTKFAIIEVRSESMDRKLEKIETKQDRNAEKLDAITLTLSLVANKVGVRPIGER